MSGSIDPCSTPVWEAAFERSTELDKQILATRAKTIHGLAWKIEEAISLVDDSVDAPFIADLLKPIRENLFATLGSTASRGLN